MTRLGAVLAAAAVVFLATACGDVRTPDAPDVPALPGAGQAASTNPAGSPRSRIVVVTHGQASDPFWAVVRRGVDVATAVRSALEDVMRDAGAVCPVEVEVVDEIAREPGPAAKAKLVRSET